MLEQIEANVVYDHKKHGEVLVTAVGEMYGSYSVSGEVESSPNSILVYYYNSFDGYGGMAATPITQEVLEFSRAADHIRPHERLGSDLRED